MTLQVMTTPKEDKIDVTLNPELAVQIEEAVERSEKENQKEERPAPHWYYSVPCAGARYYRY